MKKILTLIVLFILTLTIFGQVDEIKKGSRENKNKKSESKGSDHHASGSSGNVCADACASGCFELGMQVFFQGLIVHHSNLIKKRNEDPTILALDIMPHFAYNPEFKYVNFLPRIRGTWGVFSSDFRFNYLAEFDDFGVNVYRVYEWQILQLNFIAGQAFNLRVGSGLFHESYTDSITDPVSQLKSTKSFSDTYNEHSIEMSLRFNDFKVLTNLEGRIAYDYNTNAMVFSEINLRGSLMFAQMNHLNAYLTIGLIYQNYYSKVDLFGMQGGLNFLIH